MTPLLEEPDHTADSPDDFLRGLFAGVALTCLAFLVIGGSVLLGTVR